MRQVSIVWIKMSWKKLEEGKLSKIAHATLQGFPNDLMLMQPWSRGQKPIRKKPVWKEFGTVVNRITRLARAPMLHDEPEKLVCPAL